MSAGPAVPDLTELAPVLGTRADGRAAARGSRGLLITVLGELVRPAGGSVWTQSLVEAMGRLDVQEKATRQMISRLHDRGWLVRERVGRRTRWTLTPWAGNLLNEGAERIYRFGHDSRPWDGRWLVLIASMGEAQRHLRYRLTVGLTWAGFGSLGQGVWISPWIDREDEAKALLDRLSIEQATTFRSELGVLGDGGELATRAWDLPTLRRDYEDFLESTADLGVDEVADPIRELVSLVHRWRHFPSIDPELPGELLPGGHPMRCAARRFADVRRRLLEPASSAWSDIELGYGAAVD